MEAAMIPPETVKEIECYLAETKPKLRQREIGRRVGVSRTSVNAIARGKRPDYEALHRKREEEIVVFTGPQERCPGCGKKVYLPALMSL